jgi:sortase (surface protein transpeptidase)
MESNLAPPVPEVVAATDEPSLTLITCGGVWNAAISEYDQRTVVRAVLVDTTAAAGPLAGTN